MLKVCNINRLSRNRLLALAYFWLHSFCLSIRSGSFYIFFIWGKGEKGSVTSIYLLAQTVFLYENYFKFKFYLYTFSVILGVCYLSPSIWKKNGIVENVEFVKSNITLMLIWGLPSIRTNKMSAASANSLYLII